jgi:hypothetical protein
MLDSDTRALELEILEERIVVLNKSELKKRRLSDPLPGVARVYVGRPSPLGNPFAMDSEADRDSVCEQYEAWLRRAYREQPGVRAELLRLLRLLRLAQAGPLELVCWCAPLRCHADFIRTALLGMHKAGL